MTAAHAYETDYTVPPLCWGWRPCAICGRPEAAAEHDLAPELPTTRTGALDPGPWAELELLPLGQARLFDHQTT